MKIHEKEQTIGDAIEQVPKPTLEYEEEKAKFNISDKKPPPVPMEQVELVKEVVVANHEPSDRFCCRPIFDLQIRMLRKHLYLQA